MSEATHWGILGGGMLGMTLAHELRKRGKRVTLCEAAGELGGLASAWRLGDVLWDRHYHVTLLSDSALRGILDELRLDGEMRWGKTRTGFYAQGKMYSVSNPREYLLFPVLNVFEKARLAWTMISVGRMKDIRPLENVPVSEWLIHMSGRGAYEKFWSPLLRSKLGKDYASVSAAFLAATIQRLSAARKSGLKEEMFGYLPGGYARILKGFEAKLRQEGVCIEVNQPAERVEPSSLDGERDGRVRVRFRNGAETAFDRVALTMPASIAASLCPELNAEERARLNGIEYQGIICASVLLSRPLSSFYVTNLADSSLPFTGVIEMTALVDRAQFGGNHLVYLPRYLRPDDSDFALSDEQVREKFMGALKRMYPDLEDAHVLTFQVSRVHQVFARPTLHYSDRLPPVDTSVPGIHILNSAHITAGTLNVNETVTLAQYHAERWSHV